jgi:hypothetical protein
LTLESRLPTCEIRTELAREAQGAWGVRCAAGSRQTPPDTALVRSMGDPQQKLIKYLGAPAGSFKQENSEWSTVPDHQTGVFIPGQCGTGADPGAGK